MVLIDGDFVKVPKKLIKDKYINDYFIIEAVGNSMVEVGINYGDLLLFYKTNTLEVSGDVYLISFDGQAQIKRVFNNSQDGSISIEWCDGSNKTVKAHKGDWKILGIFVRNLDLEKEKGNWF